MRKADLTWGGRCANKYASLGEAGRELQSLSTSSALELPSVAFTVIS